MEQAWRWYGPDDPVTLEHVKQAGATGIVTALHDVPIGDVWTVDAIEARKSLVERSGLTWSVAESIPVHEAIKQGREPERSAFIDKYKASVTNLGRCGVRLLCYNFMPVIDWTRTDLERAWPDGSRALAFDLLDFAAFELHLLQRPGAEACYDAPVRARAAARFADMSEGGREALARTVTAGLPGRTTAAGSSLADFQACLDAYAGIDKITMQANLAHFLREVVPAAAAAGVYMAIHPDDPPMPLLGLPRVVSCESDVQHLLAAVDSPHNGLTFCVGSYASSSANDVEGMAERHAARTHFVHLRNVRRTDGGGSFVESDHLDGDVDMFRIVRTFAREAARRQRDGDARPRLPFRPDHGHKMLDDLGEGRATNPGYTAIGRLRGLAEIRGLQEAILRYEAKAV